MFDADDGEVCSPRGIETSPAGRCVPPQGSGPHQT